MARTKTRKQKQKTTQRREEVTYSLKTEPTGSASVSNSISKKKTSKVSKKVDLYSYDVALLKHDLLRTMLISTLIVVLQLGLYFYLR